MARMCPSKCICNGPLADGPAVAARLLAACSCCEASPVAGTSLRVWIKPATPVTRMRLVNDDDGGDDACRRHCISSVEWCRWWQCPMLFQQQCSPAMTTSSMVIVVSAIVVSSRQQDLHRREQDHHEHPNGDIRNVGLLPSSWHRRLDWVCMGSLRNISLLDLRLAPPKAPAHGSASAWLSRRCMAAPQSLSQRWLALALTKKCRPLLLLSKSLSPPSKTLQRETLLAKCSIDSGLCHASRTSCWRWLPCGCCEVVSHQNLRARPQRIVECKR